jgi:hypothetical protein
MVIWLSRSSITSPHRLASGESLISYRLPCARGCRTRSALAPRRGSQFRRVAHFAQVERLVRSYLLSCVSAGAT